MEFHVTEEMARRRRPQLVSAGAALGLSPSFAGTGGDAPAGRGDYEEYLKRHGIRFFPVAEVIKPHQPDEARQAGFTEFIPPRHLWPWSLLVLSLGDEIRRAVGRPVRLRNLYRPMSYNRLVASSGITSDHPNASAGDFDFRSEDDRRMAERVIRSRAATVPELEISLGMGARSLHVGAMSPKGPRYWFYGSYPDPRAPLRQGTGISPHDGDEDLGGRGGPGDRDEEAGGQNDEEPNGVRRPGEPQPGGVSGAGSDGPSAGAGKAGGARTPLDEAIIRRIIEQTAVHESNGDFGAVNRDGEFRGLFNHDGQVHPAFQRYHIGLSYGLVQFTQDSGTLGRLLAEMRRRDPAAFRDTFGASSAGLVELTTAPGPNSRTSPPRGARVQPLEGADLWEDPWVGRFRLAGDHQPFQEAQLVMASRIYLVPMLRFAHWLGLDSDRALGMVFDRAVQMGGGGARRWIMDTVGPIEGDAMLRSVLGDYGFATLRDFQQSVDGLQPDGEFGPLTHAALCFFERQRPASAPFVMHVPDRAAMLGMMVNAASGRRWEHRMQRLLTTDKFGDVDLDVLAAID